MITRPAAALCGLAILAAAWGAAAAEPLRLAADDFEAKLPWFYHGLPLDEWREHDVYSYEVNGLTLPPDDYSLVLVPRGKPDKLAVGFDGRTFADVAVAQGRALLPEVGIRNRMLSFYVKSPGVKDAGPLESIIIHAKELSPAEVQRTAVPYKPYRRNVRLDEREHLAKKSWPEFRAVLNRQGFGAKQLRAMFQRILAWCERRQVLDRADRHFGAIYSEEDKYDFRDAAAAAVCFTYAWRDTGEEDYRRRALAARHYCYKGQHLGDPTDKPRYGGFTHMVHGAWGPGMQRLPADGKLGPTVGVETAIIVNLLVKTYELGLEPTAEDLDRLRAAAVWMINNEVSPGVFAHHQGAKHDCQNSNALGVEALVRAYHALAERGRKPPGQWIDAARRGMKHYIEGQEAIGCWPYVFASIGRGQAFREHNLPDQGMGAYHFLVAAETPSLRDFPGGKQAMRRAARWWLCMSRLDRSAPMPTIDLDDRRAGGSLKFSKFTWCRFMAAATLMRIAELSGEPDPWRQLALRYMEHVDTKLRNDTDPDKAPFRRATSDDMTLCSWIQAAEWHGVLLREMEERLARAARDVPLKNAGNLSATAGLPSSAKQKPRVNTAGQAGSGTLLQRAAENAYDCWRPGGERTTLDGITFDSTIHCAGGHDFVKVAKDHYRFRARIDHARYAWRFYFKIECPSDVGRTVTLEVADFDHAGRTPWHEGATVYSTDDENWSTLGTENVKIVPWTPTGDPAVDKKYGDRSHVPYGVQYRLKLTKPRMWLAVPTPYTLDRRDRVMARLAKEHPDEVVLSTVGHGYHGKRHGYGLRMARVTAPGDASRRANVFIMAGEHCSETAGIHACEGWMREVFEHPDWLKRYVFHFVPIVNVDGMYYGATYHGMAPSLAEGVGQNISSNWAERTLPEVKALWPLLVKLRPVFFASLHNGRHRRAMEAFGPPGPDTQRLLAAWREELGFEIEGAGTHGGSTRAWGVLSREGITRRAFTIETLVLCRQKGFDTFEASYLASGRQLARGTMRALTQPGMGN